MSIKRVLSIFLVLCICTAMTVYAAGEEALTTDEKAIYLNQMSILSGDGTSFNLSGQLTRCEAVVFIVRLLGVESYVKENADEFRDTIFPDVPKNAWYAPYVGYCSDLGIVSGSNGKFDPDKSISEKEFLSLLLGVLGYRSGTDYTWNSVYRAAFEIGIINDASYMSKTEDNLNFKRAGAVDAMFGVLKCKMKDSNKTLIQELVSKGAVNREDAEDAGLLSDDIPTEIASVNVLDSRRISVVFNEMVEEITEDSIYIYETDNWTKKLSVEVVSQTGSELVLNTSEQIPEVDYTIEISNVFDSEGNLAELLEGTFTGYKEEKVDSDFFRVSGVEVAGNNLLYVYFTHPVNANVEYPGNY